MPVHNSATKRKSRPLNSPAVALDWLSRGIRPVPLQKGKKRPKSERGWNKIRVEPETVSDYFQPGDNIGGLWGKPSKGIVDIDLDWDEAADLAAILLPPTFVYGRQKRPGTHYLYRCKNISGSKRTLKTGEVIVEIRSTGSQSVLPPSIHPEGDRYQIDEDREIVDISEKKLQTLCDHLAGGALLIRNFPAEGSRHDFIHALTGALLWSSWKPEDAKKFVLALIQCLEDDDPGQRRRTVQNTIEHFSQGDRIAGWKTLSNWLDAPIVEATKKWLSSGRMYNKSQVSAVVKKGDEALEVPEVPEIKPFDSALLEVPGLVGEIAKWAGRRAYVKQPAFDLAAALMCTAIVATNKYVVAHWATPLQPYFMVLAPTAAGKESAASSVYEFAHKLKLDEHVFQGFQSYYALLDRLVEPPGLACWLWDEAARKLKSTRNSGSFDYQVITWLLQLYGKANSHVPGMPGRKSSIEALEKPCLTILATAQPAQMIESVSVSDLAMGLVNRFTLFDAGDDVPAPNIQRYDVFPSSIERHARDIKSLDPKQLPIEIQFESEKVFKMFWDFHEEARTHAAEGDNEVWGRANQNALILAGLVAVGVDARKPRITAGIARWAFRLIRWGVDCWSARIGQSAARSGRERESKGVERYIRWARKYANRATNAEHRTLMEKGIAPYGVLARLCRHLPRRDFDEILNHLVDAGIVGRTTDEDHDEDHYWPLV